MIANAICLSEFRVFENNHPVINEDYYILNVAPNKNENSKLFWNRVVNKMIRNPEGALVVEINGELHCAENFNVLQERPVLGNLYDGVVLPGGFQMNRIFRAEEIYLYKMEDENICSVLNGLYAEYGKLLETAARAFRDTNGRKFKSDKTEHGIRGCDVFWKDMAWNTGKKSVMSGYRSGLSGAVRRSQHGSKRTHHKDGTGRTV